MNITLSGKQVDISDRLRKHVEEALEGAVNKYFNSQIGSNVYFSMDGEEFRAEVTVHPAKNIVLKGTGVAADPYSAFDNANTHIATRLRRQKNKLNDHKGKTGIVEMAHAAVFPVTETEDEMSIDENFLEKPDGVRDEVVVYSVVNTLCELPGITKVRITINGSERKSLGKVPINDFMDLRPELIQIEKAGE